MAKSNLFKKIITFWLVLCVSCLSVAAQDSDKSAVSDSENAVVVKSDCEIENNEFILSADSSSGCITLISKITGECWYSNPADRDLQKDIKGISSMQMNSQLIITYLVNEKNSKQATSFASCSKKKGLKVAADKSGIKVVYNFISEKISIPVLYTIDSDGLVAQVINKEIKETGDNKLTEIALLPYFGAAGVNDNGYFLVPDGCGALIRFNNGKTRSNYQQEMYDTNGLLNEDTSIIKGEKARLPVFGIQKNSDSLFAVIQSGASCCRLFSYVSGATGNYNYIYPQFTYRQTDVSEMLSKTWYPVSVTFLSSEVEDNNFTVRYSPLNGQQQGYGGMASYYRNYLEEHGILNQKIKQNDVPLYIDLYGNAKVSKNILGFPVTVNKALTSFSEAEKLLEQLSDNSVDSINVRYLGISSSSITNTKVQKSFKPTGGMGGTKDFSRLLKFTTQKNIKIYPDSNFLFYKKSAFSVFQRSDAVKDVCNKTGVISRYEMSNGKKNEQSDEYYALQPEKVVNAVNEYFDSYKKQDNKYLSLSSMGNFLYSDFGKKIYLASSTEEIFASLIKKYSDEGYSLMLEFPNAYALSGAGSIIAAPAVSSCYDIEDEAVPFYQMVLHGYISYSLPSVNFADSDTSVLKAIETGSSLMYSLSYEDYSVLSYDDYDNLYSISADYWMKEIPENYSAVQQALSSVADKKIITHDYIDSGVSRTVYEDDTQIYVNYNNHEYKTDNFQIAAKSYEIVKGAG